MAGIIDTVKLAGTLVFAIPAALAGVHLVTDGVTVAGSMLIVLAIALVVVQHHLTLPSDLPGLAAKRVIGSVVSEPESEPDDDD